MNIKKLTKELQSAGIITGGCNSKGIVWDENNNEIQNRKDVKAVIAKHDPTPVPDETLDEKIERIVEKKLKAK